MPFGKTKKGFKLMGLRDKKRTAKGRNTLDAKLRRG
jgi:hypothetical protein